MSAKKYTANRPIEHNGKRFEEGETIELEDLHATPLLERGAVTAVDKNNDGKADKAKKAEGEKK